MKPGWILILFFLIFPHTLFTQTIQSIEITGNKVFDDDEYKSWLGIGSGSIFYQGLLDSIKLNVASQLSSRGYIQSSFENSRIEFSEDSQEVNIYLNIYEGDPTYINKIKIERSSASLQYEDSLFNEKFDPKAHQPPAEISMFEYLEGEIFNSFELEEIISEALIHFEDNGHPFGKIIVASVYFYKDSINEANYADVYLKVDAGPKSSIDKIEIRGNTSTKDFVIVRELRLDPGEAYSQKQVDELPKRLNRLRYFEPVMEPQFYLNSKNEGVLLIEIKEKQTNNFDGIVGYIPGNQAGEKGYLTGLVNVIMRNLFGTGRAAAIRWQQFNRFSQELELKYLEPWILGFPFNIGGGLFQRKQDTTYVQRRFDGSVEYLATEDISASLFVSTESVIPTESGNNFFTVFNSNSITTGINLKIDTRDDPYSPTEGLLFLNSYSFSRKKINGPFQFISPGLETNINLQRISLSLSGFYQLFNRQIITLGVNGRELRGSFFEESDLFRLGGTTTLRGYREDQFLGSRIFWSNLEYRLLLTRRTFAFLFFDTGYYFRKDEPDSPAFGGIKSEGFKIGYGLGLNIETGLGVLGVSFALAKGDSFSDGKIHFGLVNEF